MPENALSAPRPPTQSEPGSFAATCWLSLGNGFSATVWLTALVGAWLSFSEVAAQRSASVRTNGFIVESDRGTVQIRTYPNDAWLTLRGPGQRLNLRDSVRTEQRSSATIVNPAAVGVGLDESSRITVAGDQLLRAEAGKVFFKSLGEVRDEGLVVLLPGGKALAHGTEWVIRIDPESGESSLSVFSGSVTLVNTNLPGEPSRTVDALEEGSMTADTAPELTTARLTSDGLGHVIQWMLYYPGVLSLADLGETVTQEPALRPSVDAYRRGNLPAALTNYPAGRRPASDPEIVYRAALLLTAGRVDECEETLGTLSGRGDQAATDARLAQALRQVIAAVTGASFIESGEPALASEWLAQSYFLQFSPQARSAQDRLRRARAAALQAVELDQDFGFAWAQVAELEFSFGNREKAEAAIDRALALVPENAQAWTVKGFLLAGQKQVEPALEAFNRAIDLDSHLGNAWLGRGLVRIRQDDLEGGLQDLQVAVTQEPNRAVLRSYLAKAYAIAGNPERARSELAAAIQWDPKDPTPRFYAALIDSQENRINSAVRELEASQELNDNRAVYRSGLLLDQDQAVRGANLAAIYRDAGMIDVGVREASRAVSYDYANASAHLFLANSYDALRDPRRITLRYETPWQNELLLANLLAPAAAGTFSQNVSQQDYSRLFERDHAGVFSQTSYLGNGDWSEDFSQYGIFGNSSYAVDVDYLNLEGWRPNEELSDLTVTTKFKQQLTAKDTLLLEMSYARADSGDLIQYYDPSNASTNLHYRETQLPIAMVGYHREWNPKNHTLFLAARAEDTLSASDPTWRSVRILTNTLSTNVPPPVNSRTVGTSLEYQSQFVLYSIEAQEIWLSDNGRFTSIVGGRYQWGRFDVDSTVIPASGFDPAVTNAFEPGVDRGTFYFYQTAEVVPSLQLTAGLSYDHLAYPANHRVPPFPNPQEDTVSQVSPKAGFIWTPQPATHVRFAYAESVGGASFDQSFRLEPNQVAGFVQSYRTLIPESQVGSVAAPVSKVWGASVDHRFRTGTYVGLTGEWLQSDATVANGGFYRATPEDPLVPTTLSSEVDFTERNLYLTLNQLLGEYWSLGANYRFSRADVEQQYTDVGLRSRESAATVNSVDLFLLFNHPSGFFAGTDALWLHQDNDDPSNPNQTGDDLWQLNLMVGWRFLQRRVEVSAGVLNLTDQDYHFSPLNLIPYLPRERVFVASLKLSF